MKVHAQPRSTGRTADSTRRDTVLQRIIRAVRTARGRIVQGVRAVTRGR